MSEGSNLPQPAKIKSWLHSVPSARARNRLNALTPVQVAAGAVADIRENVRRNLDAHYSSENSSRAESPVRVVIEPEPLIEEIANNLIDLSEVNRDANRLHPRRALSVYSSNASRISGRRSLSLTSYDDSIFDPYEFYSAESDRSPIQMDQRISQESVDHEIERLRSNLSSMRIEGANETNDTNALLREALQRLQAMEQRFHELNGQEEYRREIRGGGIAGHADNENLDITYGRTVNDVRNRPVDTLYYMTLKEAREIIPTYDGSSTSKLQEFITASTYAVQSINPREEKALVQGILCTKLKGKVMTHFQTRDIQNFEQLKQEIEKCYRSKRSITHVQLEFNTLKQKHNEDARIFGARVENLALELYEAIIEEEDNTTEQKGAFLRLIQKTALHNFLLGLKEDIQMIVRSQPHVNLHAAIEAATAEEKARNTLKNMNRQKHENPAIRNNKVTQCYRCGKLGHQGKECRSGQQANRTVLPRPSGHYNINAIEKFCINCKKKGHLKKECWILHGRPEATINKRNTKVNNTRVARNERRNKESDDAARSSDDELEGERRRRRKASEYQVTQVTGVQKKAVLDMINMPISETRKGRISLLLDTGAAVTFLKVRNVKGETPVYEEKMALTGVTGHTMYTIGKIKATIKLKDRVIRHPIYIIKDDFPIEYEGILGRDFLQKYGAALDYPTNKVTIMGTKLKLYPYGKIRLAPRSETIIQVSTERNGVGLVKAEEMKAGVFIGNCLVEPKDYRCQVSVMNTTETLVEIQTPCVKLESIEESMDICVIPARREDVIGNSRIARVREKLRIEHMNDEERKSVVTICEDFNDIFHLEGEALTHTTEIKHEITTRIDSAPVNVRPYRLPQKHKEEVNKQIKEMVKNKIIRSSTSQWNAPLLVVPKKPDASGKPKLRVVVDFRRVNDLTIGDSFPLPNITDILDQLGNAKYFSTLDLASGYHQIEMEEKDKCKTAFSTPHGHYEFNRMPFGLKNAPATFQRLMNSILAGMQGIKCLVYLDDIVIYGPSLQEHNRRLVQVLKRLRESNLKLQPDKCEFLRKEVTYLGHIISDNGIKPDPEKITAVKEFPVPTKVKEIQAFIGLAGYYRKFIENFSKIAKPLTQLTKKGEKFVWSAECQNAFDNLKDKLTTAPVLKYPDFDEEFLVTTDASDYAIGAVLSQGKIGQDRPVAYASRVLSKAERNYNTTEKELLAIVWAVKHFRPYLYGTDFKIITDHKPLVWLFSVNDPGSRLIRWRLKLEEYSYKIIHKAGKTNTNADALSRCVPQSINLLEETEVEDITKKYTEEDKCRIIGEYHDTPTGGHQGVERTIKRIRPTHNWQGMTRDVEEYIAKCRLCQQNKLTKRFKAPLVVTDTPDKAFEKCALDIVGPLTLTNNGHKYILTFQDSLTKFSKAIPIANQEAVTVAKEFVTKIVLEYGIPEKILTDQGTNFMSQMFRNVCKLLKIEKIQTTAYHPESNGALERLHRTLAEYLRHYINPEQTDWDEWLPYAMFTYNTTPHTATSFTPFELVYGQRANLPTALSKPPKPTYSYDDYTQELRERLRATQQIAKENVKQEKLKSKEYYDQKTKETKFRVGDKVLLYDETVRRGRSKKLDSLWVGPYIITEKHSDVNYTVKRGRRAMKTHINRMKAFIEH